MSRLVNTVASTLPADDDHPYRTGAWAPNHREWDADDLEVEGELPADLAGVYLRNTENPVHPSIGMYHPFDGDGMLHSIRFEDGRRQLPQPLRPHRRLPRRAGRGAVAVDRHARPARALAARGRLGRAGADEGRVEHRRRRPQRHRAQHLLPVRRRVPARPDDAGRRGQGAVGRGLPEPDRRVGAPEARRAHRRAAGVRLRQGVAVPALRRGQRGRASSSTRSTCRCPGRACPTTWPSPSATRSSTTCRSTGRPTCSSRASTCPASTPTSRAGSASCPASGSTDEIRWFEADPTYVLHWINAFEDGDEVVRRRVLPAPPVAEEGGRRVADGVAPTATSTCSSSTPARTAGASTWPPGQTKEEPLSDRTMEFGMINGRHAGLPYRYSYDVTGAPGWFLFDGLVKHDVVTGAEQRYAFGEGVFGSETPFAPRSAPPPRTTATSSPSRRTCAATARSAWCSTPPTSPSARSRGCASPSASPRAPTPAGRRLQTSSDRSRSTSSCRRCGCHSTRWCPRRRPRRRPASTASR